MGIAARTVLSHPK